MTVYDATRNQGLFFYDDVIKWKHFPRYWPFVRGIHQSPVSQWRHNERDGMSNHRRLHCFSTVSSGAVQRKHQKSESLGFVRGMHRWSVKSPHKRPVTRKTFPFGDVIMISPTTRHVTRQQLQGLSPQYLIVWSSPRNTLEDRARVDAICGRPIFKWFTVTWPKDRAEG